MLKPVIFIVIGLLVIIVSVGASLGIIAFGDEGIKETLLEVIGTIGGVWITIYGIWKMIPEFGQRFVAQILRKIPSLPVYFKRRTIKSSG